MHVSLTNARPEVLASELFGTTVITVVVGAQGRCGIAAKGVPFSPFIMHRTRLVDHSCIIPVKIKFPSCSPRHKSSGAGPLKLAHALYLIKAHLELFFLP